MARLDRLESFSNVKHMTLLTGELAAPFLPDASYMNHEEADAEFLAVVKFLMKSHSITEIFSGLSTASYLRHKVTGDGDIPIAFPFTQADQDAMTFARYLRLMSCLSRTVTEDVATDMGLTVIVNLIVAVCKQGTVSSHFVEKIRHAIQQDVGRSEYQGHVCLCK